MTKLEAAKKIIELADAETPGQLSTVICQAVGISFDTFLWFSQMRKIDQVSGLKRLAQQLKLYVVKEELGLSKTNTETGMVSMWGLYYKVLSNHLILFSQIRKFVASGKRSEKYINIFLDNIKNKD